MLLSAIRSRGFCALIAMPKPGGILFLYNRTRAKAPDDVRSSRISHEQSASDNRSGLPLSSAHEQAGSLALVLISYPETHDRHWRSLWR